MSAHMRPAPGPRPGGPGGPGGLGMTLPAEKAKDFKGTFRRLLRRLRPERVIIAVVLGLAVVSVFFQVLGPWLLGQATNVIFGGVVGKMIPPGVSKEQAIAGLPGRAGWPLCCWWRWASRSAWASAMCCCICRWRSRWRTTPAVPACFWCWC